MGHNFKLASKISLPILLISSSAFASIGGAKIGGANIGGYVPAAVATTPTARQYTAADNEYHTINDIAQVGLDPSGHVSFYIDTWVYLASEPAAMTAVGKYNFTGDQRSYRLEYDQTSDKFLFRVSSDGTATGLTTVTANNFGAVTTGVWYRIKVKHDHVNDIIGISVNNGPFDTEPHSTGVFDTGEPFNIGRNSNGQYWDGRIQATVFVSGIPSADEQDAMWNVGDGVFSCNRPSLASATYVSFWDGQESSGNLADQVGSNTLTDVNGVTNNPGHVLAVC